MTQNNGNNWGGKRKEAGRKKSPFKKRLLVVRCDDHEWQELLANVPSDGREKYLALLKALGIRE